MTVDASGAASFERKAMVDRHVAFYMWTITREHSATSMLGSACRIHEIRKTLYDHLS